MMRRVFIIHGWGGKPNEHWLPWLQQELERKHFTVLQPAMPKTDHPRIRAWVSHLKKTVGKPDKDTYLIGHSIGCQAILRFLACLPKGKRVGGVILVAPWMTLTMTALNIDEKMIAKPWLTTPLAWNSVREKSTSWLAIFSDNDPWIPLANIAIFKKHLGARTVILHKKGHFLAEDGVTSIPAIKKIISSW